MEFRASFAYTQRCLKDSLEYFSGWSAETLLRTSGTIRSSRPFNLPQEDLSSKGEVLWACAACETVVKVTEAFCNTQFLIELNWYLCNLSNLFPYKLCKCLTYMFSEFVDIQYISVQRSTDFRWAFILQSEISSLHNSYTAKPSPDFHHGSDRKWRSFMTVNFLGASFSVSPSIIIQ